MVNVQVTQETFDIAVQENVEILGMTSEEAIQDAIKQFETQGADLSAICKDPNMYGEKIKLIEKLCDDLKKLDVSNVDVSAIRQIFSQLIEDFEVNECSRRIAVNKKIHESSFNILLNIPLEEVETHLLGIKFLLSLTKKNPGLLTADGETYMVNLLENNVDVELIKQDLKLIKQCCTLNELNRQHLIEKNIVPKLKYFLQSERHSSLLRSVLAVFRTLVLSDDLTVEFSKAHDHAKLIASETIIILPKLMEKLKSDEAISADLILTLSQILVRNEFCKQVVEEGLLEILKEVMEAFPSNENVAKYSFMLLRVLSGSDDCKRDMILKGFTPVISNVLNKNKASATAVSGGLRAIAALTLRSPENSKVFFEHDFPKLIIDCMKLHPGDKNVQKSGSWAIRNMVSRSRYQNSTFLDLGVEDILKNDLDKFKEFAFDFKAALRDLECEVQLKEEWTGKGGLLSSQCTSERKN